MSGFSAGLWRPPEWVHPQTSPLLKHVTAASRPHNKDAHLWVKQCLHWLLFSRLQMAEDEGGAAKEGKGTHFTAPHPCWGSDLVLGTSTSEPECSEKLGWLMLKQEKCLTASQSILKIPEMRWWRGRTGVTRAFSPSFTQSLNQHEIKTMCSGPKLIQRYHDLAVRAWVPQSDRHDFEGRSPTHVLCDVGQVT